MWSYILAGLAMPAAFAGGYYLADSRKPAIVEKVVYRKGETKVEYRDRVVYRERTRTVAPDGTVTETETTTDRQRGGGSSRTDTRRNSTPTPAAGASRTNYSLGVRHHVRYSELVEGQVGRLQPTLQTTEITGGYRLLGDFWLEGGVMHDNFSLGITYKW